MLTTLITGLPRSGTSFVCACLNTAHNCVALVEPMTMPDHGDPARAIKEIEAFCAAARLSIINTGTTVSKHFNGSIVDNTFEPASTTPGLRRSQTSKGQVAIRRAVDNEFRLFVKHPAIFSALAVPLSHVLPLFAVVRCPLAVLASWQTVDMPVRLGRMPAAERFCPELAAALDARSDQLGRQITLLAWLFQTYALLPPENILRYEEVAKDPALGLRALTGGGLLSHVANSFDMHKRYAGVDWHRLAEALLEIRPEVERFYPDFASRLEPYLRA